MAWDIAWGIVYAVFILIGIAIGVYLLFWICVWLLGLTVRITLKLSEWIPYLAHQSFKYTGGFLLELLNWGLKDVPIYKSVRRSHVTAAIIFSGIAILVIYSYLHPDVTSASHSSPPSLHQGAP